MKDNSPPRIEYYDGTHWYTVTSTQQMQAYVDRAIEALNQRLVQLETSLELSSEVKNFKGNE